MTRKWNVSCTMFQTKNCWAANFAWLNFAWFLSYQMSYHSKSTSWVFGSFRQWAIRNRWFPNCVRSTQVEFLCEFFPDRKRSHMECHWCLAYINKLGSKTFILDRTLSQARGELGTKTCTLYSGYSRMRIILKCN